MMKRRLLVLGVIAFVSTIATSGPGAQPKRVQRGSLVAIEYTLTDDDGKVLDSTIGKQPLRYLQGSGQIIPGLERRLEGLRVGQQRIVRIPPEEAYGRVNPVAFQEIPRSRVPPDDLRVGATVLAHGPRGEKIPVRIREVREKSVVVDFNHPLAGKTLTFDVKIVDVQSNPRRYAPQQ